MAGHSYVRWTPEQHAIAMGFWRDGVRVCRIGERIGKTKNAVIGRADRSGWGPHPDGHDYRAHCA